MDEKVTRLALMNSKLTQSLSMHNLAASFHSDTSGLRYIIKILVMVMVMVTSMFRVNSASVPLLLTLELPALPQPRLHHGLDVHPLQLVQRPVQHVHPRSTQLFCPPGPLIGTQPSAAELKPLKRGGREDICDTKKEKHIPKTP